MKQNIFLVVAIALTMISCNKEDSNETQNVSDYPSLIVGKWDCLSIRGGENGNYQSILLTDSGLFLRLEFDANGMYTVSSGREGYPEYNSTRTTDYEIKGNILFVYWREDNCIDTTAATIHSLNNRKLITQESVEEDGYSWNQEYEFVRITN